MKLFNVATSNILLLRRDKTSMTQSSKPAEEAEPPPWLKPQPNSPRSPKPRPTEIEPLWLSNAECTTTKDPPEEVR